MTETQAGFATLALLVAIVLVGWILRRMTMGLSPLMKQCASALKSQCTSRHDETATFAIDAVSLLGGAVS